MRSDRGLKEDCSRAVSKTEFISDPVPEDFSDCVEAAVAGLGPIPGKLTWCRFLFYCAQDCAWGLRRAVNKGGTSEEGSSDEHGPGLKCRSRVVDCTLEQHCRPWSHSSKKWTVGSCGISMENHSRRGVLWRTSERDSQHAQVTVASTGRRGRSTCWRRST